MPLAVVNLARRGVGPSSCQIINSRTPWPDHVVLCRLHCAVNSDRAAHAMVGGFPRVDVVLRGLWRFR